MAESEAHIVERFAAIVGPDHVDFDPQSLARRFPSTAPHAHRPLGCVSPQTTDEVLAVVKAARMLGVALYPISRGRNWGYGDAAPTTPGQVIVDLSRMNRIRKIDDRLAYATIEPGVTQGQLSAALAERGDRLWCDVTGAGPEASIVGNVLERGYGHTAYGDRLRSVCGLEVVLGDGSVVRTGFSGVTGSAVGAVYPYGIGPYLDGLFTQSGFAIVTEMTIWLMPAPEQFTAVLCQLANEQDIGELVERIRVLRLEGTLNSIVHIANDLRLISGRVQYPETRTGGHVPLPRPVRRELAHALDIAPWSFSAALYGDRAQVRAARRRVNAILKDLKCKLYFIDDRKLALGKLAARVIGFTGVGRRLRERLDLVEPAIGLLKGRPTNAFLAGAYWRAQDAMANTENPDPARDGCGLLWHAPVLPATGEDVRRLIEIVEPILAAYAIDFLLTLSSVTARSLSAVMTIAFRQNDPEEKGRATACYHELVEATARGGYPAYRANSQMMDVALRTVAGRGSYWTMIANIKAALDPDGVIAPGRYLPDGAVR
ncbi:MAG: FAD-binding oxidoreductase [Alphaproteobacteria bacterium]|nr:MAG: FAD-binding oxidoreductase [Alphaproteobacteria bacterium]